MREMSLMIELYQNLLLKMEKYGDLPTEERKIMLSVGGFIRARADLLEQQHLVAADNVRAQRIGEVNVRRTTDSESTPDTTESA